MDKMRIFIVYMEIPMRDFDSIVSPAKLLTPEIV